MPKRGKKKTLPVPELAKPKDSAADLPGTNTIPDEYPGKDFAAKMHNASVAYKKNYVENEVGYTVSEEIAEYLFGLRPVIMKVVYCSVRNQFGKKPHSHDILHGLKNAKFFVPGTTKMFSMEFFRVSMEKIKAIKKEGVLLHLAEFLALSESSIWMAIAPINGDLEYATFNAFALAEFQLTEQETAIHLDHARVEIILMCRVSKQVAVLLAPYIDKPELIKQIEKDATPICKVGKTQAEAVKLAIDKLHTQDPVTVGAIKKASENLSIEQVAEIANIQAHTAGEELAAGQLVKIEKELVKGIGLPKSFFDTIPTATPYYGNDVSVTIKFTATETINPGDEVEVLAFPKSYDHHGFPIKVPSAKIVKKAKVEPKPGLKVGEAFAIPVEYKTFFDPANGAVCYFAEFIASADIAKGDRLGLTWSEKAANPHIPIALPLTSFLGPSKNPSIPYLSPVAPSVPQQQKMAISWNGIQEKNPYVGQGKTVSEKTLHSDLFAADGTIIGAVEFKATAVGSPEGVNIDFSAAKVTSFYPKAFAESSLGKVAIKEPVKPTEYFISGLPVKLEKKPGINGVSYSGKAKSGPSEVSYCLTEHNGKVFLAFFGVKEDKQPAIAPIQVFTSGPIQGQIREGLLTKLDAFEKTMNGKLAALKPGELLGMVRTMIESEL